MRSPRVLLLSLALLLGGCVSAATDPEPEPPVVPADDAGEDAAAPPAPPASSPSSAPATNASSSSPAPAPSNATAPEPAAPAASGPRVKEVAGEGSVGLQAALPCGAAPAPAPAPCDARHEADPVALAFPEPSPAKAVLVVTWEAATPAATTLAFNATSPAGLVLARASGESPLTLEIPPDLLGGIDALSVQASPEAPGVVASQAYKLALTLTYV